MNVSYLQKNKTAVAAAVGVFGAAAIGVTLYYRSKPSEHSKDASFDKADAIKAPKDKAEDVSMLVTRTKELEYNNILAHGSVTPETQKIAAKKYVNSNFTDTCKGVENRVVSSKDADAIQIVHPMEVVRDSIARFVIQSTHDEAQLTAVLNDTLDNMLNHLNNRNKSHAAIDQCVAKTPEVVVQAELDSTHNTDINHLQADQADDEEERVVENSVYVTQYALTKNDETKKVTIRKDDSLFCLSTQLHYVPEKEDEDIDGVYGGLGLLKAVVDSAAGGAVCGILAPENYQDKCAAAKHPTLAKRATETNIQDAFHGDREIVLALMGYNYKTEKTQKYIDEFFKDATHVENKLFQHKMVDGAYIHMPGRRFAHTVITSTLRNGSIQDSDYAVLYTVAHGALITKQVCDILEAYVSSLFARYVQYYSLDNLLLDVDDKGVRRPRVKPQIQDLCIIIEQQAAKVTKHPLDMFVKDVTILAANIAIHKMSHILATANISNFSVAAHVEAAFAGLSIKSGQQVMDAIREAMKQMRVKVVTAADKVAAIAYGSQSNKEYEQQLAQHRQNYEEAQAQLSKLVTKFKDMYQFGVGTQELADKVHDSLDDADTVDVTFEERNAMRTIRPSVLENTARNIYDALEESITAKSLERFVTHGTTHDYPADSNALFPTITTAELNVEDFKLRLAMYEHNPAINTYVYRQNINTLIAELQKATSQDVYCHLAEVVASVDKGILESEKLQAEHDYITSVSHAVAAQSAHLKLDRLSLEEQAKLLKSIKDVLDKHVEHVEKIS